MAIKYMYNGQLHVGFFFCQLNNICPLIFFSQIYQGHVWYHCGLHILRVFCLYTHCSVGVQNIFPAVYYGVKSFFKLFVRYLRCVVNNTWERIHLNLCKNQILRMNTFFTCTNLSICELFNDKQLTPQYACETTSLLNLKLVCCKAIFQLYKCMYGLKCYQLYHVLLCMQAISQQKCILQHFFSQLYHDLL